ncbi:MAG: FAD-binding protein [Deltaproteobacteria bacterium]|nr:FAD-binding protein [Deltaproteobacteria bacterium]MCL5276641.1 FAD-binding protein [Deltaproteobacteria bacterium]
MDYDVIVIGSGIAGTLAAINAARTKRVAVVRKGYGATALSSGAFDIAGKGGRRGRPFKGILSLSEAIGNILDNEPLHPYSILSTAFMGDRFNEFSGMVRTIGDQLFGELGADGMRYEGSWESTAIIPNQHGTFKITSFCQSSMISGNLTRLMGRAILFIGFERTAVHNKTRASFISDTLSKYGLAPFKSIDCANIDLQSHGIRCDGYDFISIAGMMDNAEYSKRVLGILRQSLDRMEYEHVFLPPIMGIANHRDVLKMFTDSFGDTVSEFMSPPSSAPGLRLQYALDRLLARHGVAIIDGDAAGTGPGDAIKTIRVSFKDGRKASLSADSFVLATGKFISGGIVNGRTWQEAVFGLPVFIGTHRVRDPFPMGHLTDDPFDKQELFSIGVRTDSSLRPVDANGRTVYKNLHAAGSVLSGYNYLYDKTGMGTAMITGARAGIFSAG